MIRVFQQQRLANHSRTWPSTTGTITAVEAETARPDRFPHQFAAPLGPYMEYEYYVHGKLYRSRTVSYGVPTGATVGGPVDALQKYQIGDTTIVYYNPDHPEQAVLIPGGSAFQAIFSGMFGTVLLMLVILLAIGLVIWFLTGALG